MRVPHPGLVLALLAGAVEMLGCGPKVTAVGPGVEPAKAETSRPPPAPPTPPAQEVLVGEMCPAAAADRPAVVPLFARGISWSTAADEVAGPLERREARQFSVLDWEGARAGLFSVVGVSEVKGRKVAIGSYAGGSPCARGEDELDPNCVVAQNQCGLAFSLIEPSGGITARPFEEDPDPVQLSVAGGCVAGDRLLVDIDGDGRAEAYPVASFLDPVRAPAEEVGLVPHSGADCTPHFAVRHIVPPGDPKHWNGLDLLGVIDLDGDGRNELVLSYHYSDRRTWAIYTADSSVARLDLAGEAIPWPRP